MIVIRDQQLRLLVLAQLIRELQAAAAEQGPVPPGSAVGHAWPVSAQPYNLAFQSNFPYSFPYKDKRATPK